MVVFLKDLNLEDIKERINLENKKLSIHICNDNKSLWIQNQTIENYTYGIEHLKKSYLGERIISNTINFSFVTHQAYIDIKIKALEFDSIKEMLIVYGENNKEVGSIILKDNDLLRIGIDHIHLVTDNILTKEDYPNY
ncbi:MAG: hypothetical protein Q8N08_05730 [Methanobacteriaceae archaeon]|nr:hypothetical protein [Methanobacteriaceae archaeon]